MIEELDDIVTDLADKLGVYGSCASVDEACVDKYKCRSCFESDLEDRIRLAIRNEESGVRGRRVTRRRNPMTREHSSLAKLQEVMTEYFKVLVEKEKNAEPVKLYEMYPVPTSPAPVTSPFTSDGNPTQN